MRGRSGLSVELLTLDLLRSRRTSAPFVSEDYYFDVDVFTPSQTPPRLIVVGFKGIIFLMLRNE